MEGGWTTTDANGLHLKKKLTRIRKASRALMDPGTSCVYKHQNHDENGQIETIVSDEGNSNTGRGVFLHNWRNQESENARTRQNGEDNGGSSRMDASIAPSIGNESNSNSFTCNRCKYQICSPQTHRFDDSEGHYNSEDLAQESEVSPLFARLADTDRASSKLRNQREDNGSASCDKPGLSSPSIGEFSDDDDECSLNSSLTSRQGLGEHSPTSIQSLSHKYRPTSFSDLIGQNIFVQSLMSSIGRRRIAPVYLFHGPHGTGKTSAARIFAAALNCLSTEETAKPCGACNECANFISGKRRIVEVDGSDKKGLKKIRHLVGNPSTTPSRYNVFIVDECRSLPPKMWRKFLELLQKPVPGAVFILTTTHINNVPCPVLSHCRKHHFYRIRNIDIIARLMKISNAERLDVELDALELIASSADGSLRDAETMLDQLSLFGEKITQSLVNELMGVVPDDKLLDLLELAMSSRATETVIQARELMNSGVDPIVLMSQLVALIINIIGGTCSSAWSNHNYSFAGGRCLSKGDVNRLKHALVFLSQAEKQLSIPRDRATWFTATLLQLDNMPSHNWTHSMISTIAAVDCQDATDQADFGKQRSAGHPLPDAARNENLVIPHNDSNTLHEIWLQCVEKCYPETLQQLLRSHGRLVSISETEGGTFVAHIVFSDIDIKTQAESFLCSIISSLEAVLKRGVEVKIALLEDSSGNGETSLSQENESRRANTTRSDSDACTIDQTQPQPVGENMEMNQMPTEDGGLNSTSKHGGDQLSHDIQVPTSHNASRQQKGKIATKTDHNLIDSPSMFSSSIGSYSIQCSRQSGLGGGCPPDSQMASARFPKAKLLQQVVGGSGRHGCRCLCFRCFEVQETKEQHSRHRS